MGMLKIGVDRVKVGTKEETDGFSFNLTRIAKRIVVMSDQKHRYRIGFIGDVGLVRDVGQKTFWAKNAMFISLR